MTIHMIKPTREVLHGCFSREIAPVFTIEPGDSVRYQTLDADWIAEFRVDLQNPPPDLDAIGERFSPRSFPYDDGHALCGPIAIRGAQPDMMLAITFNRIIPGEWGWTYPWYGIPIERKDEIPLIVWHLDAARMIGRNQFGHTVKLHPFMGVIGMPSAEPGIHPTKPPRINGGNIDCKELVAGTTLYLPVAVAGGLFSLGDGHAAQGDGESGGTAIECPMALVDVTLDLVNPLIMTPYANTPAGWLTFGFDQDLQTAYDMASEAMQHLISALYGVEHRTALGLMGAAVDMRVTQTVNDVKGVHALLPHGALR